MNQSGFAWIPFYEELANSLVSYGTRQKEPIDFLEQLRSQGLTITPLEDKDGRSNDRSGASDTASHGQPQRRVGKDRSQTSQPRCFRVGSYHIGEQMTPELCAICRCPLHRSGVYAEPTIQGRSHATKHHFVADRFFGRSKNRPGTSREGIFAACPWGFEGESGVFCYECHEELLHNPVLLPQDIRAFAGLVRRRGLSEGNKTNSKEKIAGRVKLFHEIVVTGLNALLSSSSNGTTNA